MFLLQCIEVSKRLIQKQMLKAFSHPQGQDIFILNSYGYLIHRWARRNSKNLQDYKIIAEDVSCNPAIVYVQPIFHIFYIDRLSKLKHLQINSINTLQTSEILIASEIEGKMNLLNVTINNQTVYLQAHRKGKTVYFINKIKQRQSETNDNHGQIKTSKIYQIKDIWKQRQENASLEGICRLETNNTNQAAYQRLFDWKLQYENQKHGFNCILKMVKSTQSTPLNHKFTFQLQTPLKNSATLLNVDQSYFLLYLDQNEQLIRRPLQITHQNTVQIGKSQSRPYLIWQQIQSKCTPLGEQGYHADCFYYSQQNLVIKKFRKPSKAFKSNRQVYYLKQIQQIQPNLFHHDIISQGIIKGFSMTFFPGQNWYQLTSNPDNILNRSPVARVQLVIKLGEFMRKLQEISFCHGDLHLENVIIHVQQQDLVYPKISIKIIDFGNGFEMVQGETVSQGLTGFSPIVPPQAEFSYKLNYNPFGLNAYQFGRNSLYILLKNAQRNLCKLDYTPLRQLQSLKQNKQYPSDLYLLMKQLVHYQIDKRNNALAQNIFYLEQQTRKIYVQNQKDK